MKRSFIFLIKFMPVIQMAGMFVTNILFCFKISNKLNIINSIMFGDSIIATLLLLLCSYMFGFCKWHRAIIYGNLISILIELYDKVIGIPISNLEILVLYNSVIILFAFIALIYKFKCKKYETSIENISERIA